MLKTLNKKITKKGFTLAELLVVVAILAILVAVSIPIFTGKLDDAKKATDAANLRAAKAAAVVEYLDDKLTTNQTYYYDAKNGTVSTSDSGITGYNQVGSANTKIVKVVISASGTNIEADWE